MTLSGFADIITIIAGSLAIVAFFIALEWRQDYQEQQVDQITQEILVLLDSLHFNICTMRLFWKVLPIEIFFKRLPEFIIDEDQKSKLKNDINAFLYPSPQQDSIRSDVLLKALIKDIKSSITSKLEEMNKDLYLKLKDEINFWNTENKFLIEAMWSNLENIRKTDVKIHLKFKMYSRRKSDSIFKIYEKKYKKNIQEINLCGLDYLKFLKGDFSNIEHIENNLINDEKKYEPIFWSLCLLPKALKTLKTSFGNPKEVIKDRYENIGTDDFSKKIEENFKEITKKLEDEGLVKAEENKPQ